MAKITLQDAWGLAGDRRFDNLDMPILDDPVNYAAKADKAVKTVEMLELTTDVPRQSQSFPAFLAGEKSEVADLPVEQRLSAILRYLASPMRYEPMNTPDVHYPVSSFGGLFSCGIKFIRRHPKSSHSAPTTSSLTNQVDVYHYHANYHALEKSQTNVELAIDLQPNELLIGIVGHYWAVGRKYGEYAPFGVVLDSGIVFAHTNYLLQLFGLPFTTNNIELAPLNDCLVPAGSCQQTLAAIKVQLPESAQEIFSAGTEQKRIAIWQEPEGLFERFTNLQQMVDLLAVPYQGESVGSVKPAMSKEKLPSQIPNHDVLNVIYNRTAANDGVGFSQVNKTVDANFLVRFMQTLAALRARRDLLPEEDLLMLKVAWINSYGPPTGLYDEQGEVIYQATDVEGFQDIIRDCLYSDRQQYNLSTMTLELFISVDTAKITENAGNSAFRLAHMGAGAVSHDVCLAASLFDGFARPVRMFRDTKLQQRLGLDGQLLIQVLVGFNRHNNYALTLL